jgi:PAS domain S-box-containing protein
VSSKTTKFEGLLEAVPDALVGVDHAGVIRFVNRQTELLFSYDRDDLIGAPLETLVPESLRPAHKVHRERYVAAPVTRTMGLNLELHGRRRDGTQFPVDITLSHTDTEDGPLVIAAARDMTEARQAFHAARSMIESSLDSLVAISPEGKITDANQATVKLTGVPREQLIGTSFSDYFTDPAKAEAIYQQVFTEGMAVDYPLTLRHRDGQETLTEVLYNASVYRDAAGKVLGVFAAARDVTEQMQAQREGTERLAELEQFQRLTVGREVKMIELKKEIEYLKKFGSTEHGESDGQA